MPDPVAPQPISVPDLRKVPDEAYRSQFTSLVKRLRDEEVEHTLEVPPKPLADPKLTHAEYQTKYAELRRKLYRG
jgi:hypothetical protein